MRTFSIHMPLYGGVKELQVGLDRSADLLPAPPYAIDKPVVYYGSSITQGGCASRPGCSYQAILSRTLQRDHVDLGFSASARGESVMAQYVAGVAMSACWIMTITRLLSRHWRTHMSRSTRWFSSTASFADSHGQPPQGQIE